VIGSFHSPLSRVRVHQDSVLAGRMTAGELTLENRGELLLDPIFDNKMGITEKTSPLYDENGDPVPGLKEALEGTSDAEGFAAAMSRILAALPALPVLPVDDGSGATPRDGDRVTPLRDWPVQVRMQESSGGKTAEDTIFTPIQNATAASKLGSLVDEVTKEALGAEPDPDPKSGKSGTSVNDVLSAVLGGGALYD
jgi:hypothetical protein